MGLQCKADLAVHETKLKLHLMEIIIMYFLAIETCYALHAHFHPITAGDLS